MRIARHRRAPKGSWKMQCDLMGNVYYSTEMTKQWNNLYVGRDVFEPRNPQDIPIITKERNMVGTHPLVPSPGNETTPDLPPLSASATARTAAVVDERVTVHSVAVNTLKSLKNECVFPASW